jgi:hypothetical protein
MIFKDLREVADQFGIDGSQIEQLTAGLIHQTYKVVGTQQSYVLQRVNTNVFKDGVQVIENYKLIATHLRRKDLPIPYLKKTLDGNYWYENSCGLWRAQEFIENSYTANAKSNKFVVIDAAKGYANYVRLLSDLDTNKVVPTIDRFHDLAYRYEQLQDALVRGLPERIAQSEELLKDIEDRKHYIAFYHRILKDDAFKVRIMHHDCKLSNILFDTNTKEVICPIDLDTTMPGYFFSDLGDMIRSMISSADENASPQDVTFDSEIYHGLVQGYLAGIGDEFSNEEQKSIHYSGLIMLYMQAIRFLWDHLLNDKYYHIDFSGQNFNRASNQLNLLKKLEAHIDKEHLI